MKFNIQLSDFQTLKWFLYEEIPIWFLYKWLCEYVFTYVEILYLKFIIFDILLLHSIFISSQKMYVALLIT